MIHHVEDLTCKRPTGTVLVTACRARPTGAGFGAERDTTADGRRLMADTVQAIRIGSTRLAMKTSLQGIGQEDLLIAGLVSSERFLRSTARSDKKQ